MCYEAGIAGVWSEVALRWPRGEPLKSTFGGCGFGFGKLRQCFFLSRFTPHARNDVWEEIVANFELYWSELYMYISIVVCLIHVCNLEVLDLG